MNVDIKHDLNALTDEKVSEELILAEQTIDSAAIDNALSFIRDEFSKDVDKLISQLTTQLIDAAKEHRFASVTTDGTTTAAALRLASQGKSPDVNAIRNLAEAMVVGGIMNFGNEEWDPIDPSTHRPLSEDSLLVKLLKQDSNEPQH